MKPCLLLSAILLNAAFSMGDDGDHQEALTDEQLGTVDFPSSCSTSVARSIERAVAMLHSFWYEEAEKQFDEIGQTDPGCAIAHWGIAMSLWHPLWNGQDQSTLRRGQKEMEKARQIGSPRPRERDYIAALSALYQDPGKAYAKRLAAYRDRIQALSKAYPDDHEATAFYALSLLSGGDDGGKDRTNSKRAAEILEKLFQLEPNHPGIAHYLIHAYDSPELAKEGLPAARRYARIAPAAPHALHMPSHIFARLGLWQEDIRSNVASVDATRKEAAMHMGGEGHQFHAMDFLVYAYLQTGREAEATKIIADIKRMPAQRDMYGMGSDPRWFALSRFPAAYSIELHHWAEASELTPVAGADDGDRAFTRWAKAIGAARSGRLDQARSEVAELARIRKKLEATKKTKRDEYDSASDRLIEARAWLNHAEGRRHSALDGLRALAAQEEGEARASEGVPRHEMLGDMLLEAGQPEPALSEYELVLKANPGRFNSLYGAAQAEESLGRHEKASQYYSELVKNCEGSTSDRAELKRAREAVETRAARLSR